jgi:hypothetical protein
MMVYQEKILPPGPLPVLGSEPPEVLLSQRTIESLELEKTWLKERLAASVGGLFQFKRSIRWRLLAHFGSAVMSDLSPGCAPKQKTAPDQCHCVNCYSPPSLSLPMMVTAVEFGDDR